MDRFPARKSLSWYGIGENPLHLNAITAADYHGGIWYGKLIAHELNLLCDLLRREIAIPGFVIVQVYIATLNPEQVPCTPGFRCKLSLGNPVVRAAGALLEHLLKLWNRVPFLHHITQDGLMTNGYIPTPPCDVE